MKMMFSTGWPQFYTATILNWQPLLTNNKYKDIIIEFLQFCVKENKVKLYAFVIITLLSIRLGPYATIFFVQMQQKSISAFIPAMRSIFSMLSFNCGIATPPGLWHKSIIYTVSNYEKYTW